MERPYRNSLSLPASRPASFVYSLTVCCLVTFGFYTASYMRIPVVPLYAKSLGADTPTVGLINSVFFLTAGCLSFPTGLLSDRWGRKRVALLGTFVVFVTSFWLAFSRTPAQLMLIYFFFGVGLSAYGPTMMSYVADVSPVTHLGRSYGWYTTALYTGMSVGPAVGGWVAGGFGYGPVFVASGCVTAVLWVLILALLPAPPARDDAVDRPPLREAAGAVLRNRPLWGCWLVTLGLCFGLGMFVTFIPLHARDASIPIASIGMIFFVQGVSNALSRIPFGHWSDRTGDRRRLVAVGATASAAALVGFGFSGSLWQFLAWAALFGCGLALAFTSIGALIAVVVDPHSRGLAMGGYNTCIYFGIMLASATMGVVIERSGYPAAFAGAAAVTGVFLAVFGAFMRTYKA
ncbi:Predicted arabinose efflux permease, MFS family [Desulfacinum infernum DSM 9756]|uniref:Predicted arabinose efflux permease, MFS family n=1 Tax=Desulfacinum infernum DSM 9756 TaxID=1121391 RepID=A0A1M4YI82_9BACT|nr:MFS transporter [Desulfacinum infernum]SHF05400.1 Predicted arabinose efflux permease, MFS family [Desulfacinum infernum DSM 9756]